MEDSFLRYFSGKKVLFEFKVEGSSAEDFLTISVVKMEDNY